MNSLLRCTMEINYIFSYFSKVLTEIDISACDSGLECLDTPPSTHRPSSYRDVYYMKPGARDSTDTGVSSSRGTLVSPGGSFRAANGNIIGLRYNTKYPLVCIVYIRKMQRKRL